jgi:hypothetical protein
MEERLEHPLPSAVTPTPKASPWTLQRIVILAASVVGGIIVVLFILGLAFAIFSDAQATAPRIQIIRDMLVIIIVLEFILIVGALAVVILQVARLVSLLRSEVKPVLENTQEAVNSAKGTVEFVGDNVTEPVVRVGAFMAGAGVFLREAGGIRRAIRRPKKDKKVEPVE